MTNVGKVLRLRRLLGPRGRGVVVPMDHGVSSGPVRGVERPAETVVHARNGGADSVVVHRGLVGAVAPVVGPMGLWLHVSASTSLNPDPDDKRLVGGVEDALSAGCEGLSVHLNVGAPTESLMVEGVGRAARACEARGVPLLAMVYPRGPAIDDPHDVDLVRKVARLGWELGADVLKVPYTGSAETFREVTRCVDVPVLISGGPPATTERAFLEMVKGSLEGGGAGVSVGRNLWQHADPAAMTRAVRRLVHDDADVDAALAELEKSK